jgi:hypothetical protein
MTYIEIGLNDDGVMIFGRVDDDGLMRVTCTQQDSDYQAWLNPKAEQSTPNLS